MKTFELLKELLLIETYGAYNTVHNAINLAIQIHCDQEQIDETEFKNKVRLIHNMTWKGFTLTTPEAQQEQIKKYEQLIDTFLA